MKSRPLTSRRLFFWKAGAALSAPLAVTAAQGSTRAADERKVLMTRLALLEDMNAIRELQVSYVRHANAADHGTAATLFDDPAAVPSDRSVRRVSLENPEDTSAIEISPDGETATSRSYCVVHRETPIEPRCTLVEMALQQGGGMVKRSERVVLESAYVKRRGTWKIHRLTWRALTITADPSKPIDTRWPVQS